MTLETFLESIDVNVEDIDATILGKDIFVIINDGDGDRLLHAIEVSIDKDRDIIIQA